MGKFDTKEDFIRKAKEVHGEKYDYSLVDYIYSTAKIKIICPKHHIFFMTPSDHKSGHGCKKCHFDSIRKWSWDEDELLRKNYKEKGAYWCSEQLNDKTDCAVRRRAEVLGLTKEQQNLHEYVPAYVYSGIIHRCREEGFVLDFSIEYIWELYQKQNGKCALTGWNIVLSKNRKLNTVSVDRINSNKDYTKDNVQLTHKLVNRCKLNCKESHFFEICKAIYLNRKKDFQEYEMEWEENEWLETIFPIKKEKSFNVEELVFR